MGSGGGGSSGKVDYPSYLKQIHCDWLVGDNDTSDPANYDTIEKSMTEVIDSALGASPLTGVTAYDPGTVLDSVDDQIEALLAVNPSTELDAYKGNIIVGTETEISPSGDFGDYVDSVKSKYDVKLYGDDDIDLDVTAFGDLLSDQLETVALPRFKRGMQDINAVQTSAFVIGSALLEDSRQKEIAKYSSGLRLQNYQERNKLVVQSALALLQAKLSAITSDRDIAYRTSMADLEWSKASTTLFMEAAKMKIIANKEEADVNREIDVADAKWDMEAFQIGGNLLASVAGAAPSLVPKQNMFTSVLGGVLSGVAAGASTGNPYLAIGGGILGGISGFLGS